MPFFDAHCDTIGPIWEGRADFVTGEVAAGRESHGGEGHLHVTLPGLRSAGVCAQVFASWVWSPRFKGRELEVGLGKVEAVGRLCEQFGDDLFLARTGTEIVEACRQAAEAERAAAAGNEAAPQVPGGAPAPIDPEDAAEQAAALRRARPRTAVIASLESADPLQGEVDNLGAFHDAGVRLITFAWGDNEFLGSAYGGGGGLTAKGADLVEACEEKRVLVDVSHASDKAFWDICRVAKRPFAASHSDCRQLCPAPRNLTDEMIRALAKRGGVMGITLAPGFLSTTYRNAEAPLDEQFKDVMMSGSEETVRAYSEALAAIPRPPLELIVDHVRHALKVGGEDAVGLGGDLDGVEVLPAGLDGVGDYPRIAQLLKAAGLRPAQIDKVCWGNFARLFKEGLE